MMMSLNFYIVQKAQQAILAFMNAHIYISCKMQKITVYYSYYRNVRCCRVSAFKEAQVNFEVQSRSAVASISNENHNNTT